MSIDKWSSKWMDEHKEASLQEFAVALSKQVMKASLITIVVQVVGFIAVLCLVAYLCPFCPFCPLCLR